jgi:aryl-alcohol dehydrogenase-like predicted oxidoreductase
LIERFIGDARVGAIGLGAASWTFDEGVDERRVFDVVDAAIRAGISYIDTAAAYTTADESAHNERLLRRALRGRDVVIGTKGGHYRAGDEFPIDGSRATIRRQVDESLSALGLDALDLYFLHWPDPAIPIEESVGYIDELRAEGKIRRIGVSNVSLEQLERARSVARIAAVQNTFSPFDTSDRSLIAACARDSIAYLVYSPLGGPNAPETLQQRLPLSTARAEQLGVTAQRLVLAWELGLSPTVIPIAGATRVSTVRDSAAASDLRLDDETIAIIESEVA